MDLEFSVTSTFLIDNFTTFSNELTIPSSLSFLTLDFIVSASRCNSRLNAVLFSDMNLVQNHYNLKKPIRMNLTNEKEFSQMIFEYTIQSIILNIYLICKDLFGRSEPFKLCFQFTCRISLKLPQKLYLWYRFLSGLAWIPHPASIIGRFALKSSERKILICATNKTFSLWNSRQGWTCRQLLMK